MADLPSSFLDMLNEANSIVKADYPDAGFYEASTNLVLLGAPWQFVFSDPPAATVILKHMADGGFVTPPQHIDSPWGDDYVIPLPIDLELTEAQSICEQQGCGGDVEYITLRWPLLPGDSEPYYIFTSPSINQRCFVGVRSREVTCSPIQQSG